MAADTERQLLFGLLALQVGLIDQGQLVAAFQAWTRDRDRPMADLLTARGNLVADDRAAVEALVARHLARHGGDAEKSLAAVGAGPAALAGLASLRDPQIDASLTRVGPEPNDADGTATYIFNPAASDGQRFRVLRPHAQGGLGAVFVALDEELHREVALKQILDRHADDPASRTRFVLEAEITGGLEHPGIVPVYGLGTYADGRPYYAMRFIRGESLQEAIEQFHDAGKLRPDPGRSSLEFRKLLRRFLDICNAIDYAHARGVLHRDIKPSNIIIGKHGETLVVDWGLAKATGRSDPAEAERTLLPSSGNSSGETLPGSALGTPAYMSPEQAAGDLDRLGPRSDVYSLGATLYCLLTGKPLFEGEAGRVLRAVQKGAYPPPRDVDPSIDRALQAVCLRSLALKPEDRYASPKALADDIERWMADEPVTAWREPFSLRARRWARRNRTAVTTAAAAVLVALAGTATVLAVQTRANRHLLEANARTLRERNLARQNFNLARRAVDDYLTRVGQNPLLKEQGLHGLRQELLEAALDYYREFLGQRHDDPGLMLEAGAAHERVGDILIELGRAGDALGAYNQALGLIEPLARQRPGDRMMATAQVRLLVGRLQALSDGGRYPEAIVAFDRARDLGESLLAVRDATDDISQILARAYRSVAIVLRNNGRIDDALRSILRAHELAERAMYNQSGELSALRTLLDVSRIASELLRDEGRVDEARRMCERSIAFGEARGAAHLRDIEVRMYLAELEYNLGIFEKHQGRPQKALKIVCRASDRMAALAHENPLLIEVRSTWGMHLNSVSQLQTDLGLFTEAQQSARSSIGVFEELLRQVPTRSYFQFWVGRGYGSLGKALLKQGSRAEAVVMFRKAVAMLETSSNLLDRYNLACTLALASTIADPAEGPAAPARQRGDADRAVATLRRVIAQGWAYSDALKSDPDFDSLRSRPDFQSLLMDLAFPVKPFAR